MVNTNVKGLKASGRGRADLERHDIGAEGAEDVRGALVEELHGLWWRTFRLQRGEHLVQHGQSRAMVQMMTTTSMVTGRTAAPWKYPVKSSKHASLLGSQEGISLVAPKRGALCSVLTSPIATYAGGVYDIFGGANKRRRPTSSRW